MIQIGNKPTEDEIIATLIMLYEDQYNVKIVDLKITDIPKEENKQKEVHIRQFDSLDSLKKSLNYH